MRYKGKILKGEEVVVDSVDVAIYDDSRGRVKGWRGVFYPPSRVKVTPGDMCRLILADGRSGDIIISDVNISGSAGRGERYSVRFASNGALE